jgi:hypothetical protein
MSRAAAIASQLRTDERRFWVHGDDEDAACAAAMRWVDVIRERPAYVERRKQFLLYASMYGNLPVLGFGLSTYSRVSSVSRIALNVTANAIDSLVCKITKNRPKPTVTTVEGDYELRERAENMGKFIAGAFHKANYYQARAGAVLDACIYGTGAIKTSACEGDIVYDRVSPNELLVDDREAYYGSPRTFGQRKYYDKQVLIELYAREEDGLSAAEEERRKKIRDAILNGGKDSDEEDWDYDEACDQILVYEIWHLRSSKHAKDGRRILAVRDATIQIQDFAEDDYPLEFIRPMRAPHGFWGIGLCEKLAGIQGEINRMVRDIQSAMHLLAKPHWMLENSSKVLPAHLNNDIATIIRFSGTAPQVYVPQAMSAEVYQHLQFLYRTAYEITGVSQLSATGQKPAGLDSGVAMRTYLDEQTERFTDFVRCDEELAKGVAEKTVARARGIKGYKVNAIEKDGILELEFSAVDLKNYAVQIFPTSLLPETPEGKLAFVQNLIDGFKIDPDDALDLIDWPDTAKYAKRRLAARKNIERDIALMRKGQRVVREPIGNLDLAFRLVTEAYEEAKHDQVPEASLELMRVYLVQTNKLRNVPAPGEPPIPMPPPGMPPPMPGPMPANDVMPPPANDVGVPPMAPAMAPHGAA